MELPPGPRHLLKLIPTFAIPSLVVYIGLTLLRLTEVYSPPSPLFYLYVILARPALFLVGGYYRNWSNQRKAAALGAEVPPKVEEWSVFTLKEMKNKIKDGYPCEVMTTFTNKYGPIFQLSILNESFVVTSEPEHIKAILATQFDTFDKGPRFADQMDSLLGTGVFNVDGELWKFHRSMTRPFFSRERIHDFEIYGQKCDIALRAAKSRLEEGFSIDFQDLVLRFTLDSTTDFLIGESISSLSAGLPYPPPYASLNPRTYYEHPSTAFNEAVRKGQILAVPRLNLGSDWPLWEFWKDVVKPTRVTVDAVVQPLIEKALEIQRKEDAAGINSEGKEDSFMAHLVKHTQDPKILADELVNILVAGKDTTGCLLTFAMYKLTQHPNVESRLREEIFDKLGSNAPTFENMREMKYLRAFLNEVLRLYPPAPVNSRCNNKDTVLPPTSKGGKPMFMPANTTSFYMVMITHRRTDLWGPDALEFDPDRFLDERLSKYLIPNPYIFCPFNAGPRICLGQQYAYHEASFFIIRLIQNFTSFTLDKTLNAAIPADWASSTDGRAKEKVFPMTHLTMHVKGGLWGSMKPLKG